MNPYVRIFSYRTVFLNKTASHFFLKNCRTSNKKYLISYALDFQRNTREMAYYMLILRYFSFCNKIYFQKEI